MGYLIFLLFLNPSMAEYRVFELVIQNTETQEERTVISTLDPLQYPDYYPIQQNETVTYQDTWMCYGSTAFKKTCPNPRLDPQETLREPASDLP